jgi:hypothetical protein
MSIGTGTFLSAILISIVMLYGITKNRWGWRRIIKRVALVCLTLFLLGAAAGMGMYLYNQLPVTIAVQTELGRVRIGMTQNEVKYVKGYPPYVLGPKDDSSNFPGHPVIETGKLPAGKNVDDYEDWSYAEYGGSRIDVRFDPTRTGVIVVQCYSHDMLQRCPSIAGVSDGDPELQVIRIFGQPDSSNIDDGTKSMYFKKIGVFFKLAKQTVYLIGINDPRYQKP